MFKKISVVLAALLFVSTSVYAVKVTKVQKEKKETPEKKYSYLYDTSLIQAIKKQDLERVNFLLLANVDPNERNDEQQTPLSVATAYPSQEIVTKLLDKGANVNEVSQQGITPLMSAAAKGTSANIDLLLEYGADPNMQDDLGKTALMHAVENLNYDTVSSLLDLKKIDSSVTDKEGKTAFMYALETKDSEMLMLF